MTNLRDPQTHIAPWALPNEDIPFSMRWPRSFEFDSIQVTLDPGLELRDLINVRSHSVSGKLIMIDGVHVAADSEIRYFGGVVRSNGLPHSLAKSNTIKIEFVKQQKVVFSQDLTAKTFRPLLKLGEIPQKISLLDTEDITSLPVNLKFEGFGDIEVKIEATLAGAIVSETHTIVLETIKRLIQVVGMDPTSTEEEDKKKIQLNENYIKEIAVEVMKLLDGSIKAEDLSDEDVDTLKEWFSDIRKRKESFLILYKRVANALADMVGELLSTNPSENITLSGNTKVRAKIRTPAERLTVKIYYSDAINNQYDPLNFEVELEDKREEKGLTFEMNVTVDKVQNKPLLNVAEMIVK